MAAAWVRAGELPAAVRVRRRVLRDVEKADHAHVPGTQSVWVKTFGCAHNQSDSEYMAGQLAAYGYRVILADAEAADADAWVVNTCTVKGPSQDAMSTLLR